MASATVKKQADTRDTVRRAAAARLASVKAEALERWRGWARAISSGGSLPAAIEILSVAAILDIADPGDRLTKDAEAVEEFAQCERNAAACRAAVAEMLVEFGGDRKALAAVIAKQEKELARLRDVAEQVDSGASEPFWNTRMHQLRRSAPLTLGYGGETNS